MVPEADLLPPHEPVHMRTHIDNALSPPHTTQEKEYRKRRSERQS